MAAKKIALIVSLGILAIGIIVVGLMLPELLRTSEPPSEQPGNNTDGGNNTKPEKATINLVSTRSAFPFVQRWVTQYNNDDQAIGLVKASYLEESSTGNDDLRIVDSSAMDSSAYDAYYVPVSAQAVAIVYNVPGFPDVPSGLRLDNNTLYLILSGNITSWNDPAIGNLNKDLNLPNEKIIVVHEQGNGNSLHLISRSSIKNVTWPVDSIEASGPDELGATVRRTPYSIGYIDFSYAIQTKMTYAALGNARGQYVMPSIDSIGDAVENGLEVKNVTDGDLVPPPPVINMTRLGNSSYSFVGLYYIVFEMNTRNDTSSEQDSTIRRNATLDFVKWVVGDEGQQVLSEVGYPDLYRENPPLATYSENLISYSYNATVPGNSTTLIE